MTHEKMIEAVNRFAEASARLASAQVYNELYCEYEKLGAESGITSDVMMHARLNCMLTDLYNDCVEAREVYRQAWLSFVQETVSSDTRKFASKG